MEELETLRQLIEAGTATPEQRARYEELLKGIGTLSQEEKEIAAKAWNMAIQNQKGELPLSLRQGLENFQGDEYLQAYLKAGRPQKVEDMYGYYKSIPTLRNLFQQPKEPNQNLFEAISPSSDFYSSVEIPGQGGAFLMKPEDEAKFLASQDKDILEMLSQRIGSGEATPLDAAIYQERAKDVNRRRKEGDTKYDESFGSTLLKDPWSENPFVNKNTNSTQDTNTEQDGNRFSNLFNPNNIPYFFPGGTDLTTKLYTFGRALGAGKDQKGRVPTAVLSGASALMGATRDVLSGVGYEKMNQQMMDEYRRRIGEPRFTPESQSRNQNNSGGFEFGGMFQTYPNGGEHKDNMLYPPGDNIWDVNRPPLNMDIYDMYRNVYGTPQEEIPENERRRLFRGWENAAKSGQLDTVQAKFGGMFNTNYFDMGGEQEQIPQEMPQEGQQMPQQDPQQMMQQMAQMVAQMLQQGQDPNQIVQMLVEQGVPQEQATSIVQMVIQQMQQQGSQEQTPTTKTGEPFNAQPGQEVSFSYGGKKVTGKVKEIRNGKVILE